MSIWTIRRRGCYYSFIESLIMFITGKYIFEELVRDVAKGRPYDANPQSAFLVAARKIDTTPGYDQGTAGYRRSVVSNYYCLTS